MLACIGIPGNIFVLWLGVQLSKKLGAHNSQRIIVSMTSADLLFCSLYLPFQGATAILRITPADWLCYAVNYVSLSGMVSSSLSLLLLNVDKFFSINRPLHYKLMITNRKLNWGIAVVWLLAGVFIALLLFGSWTCYSNCVFRPREISVYCRNFYISTGGYLPKINFQQYTLGTLLTRHE